MIHALGRLDLAVKRTGHSVGELLGGRGAILENLSGGRCGHNGQRRALRHLSGTSFDLDQLSLTGVEGVEFGVETGDLSLTCHNDGVVFGGHVAGFLDSSGSGRFHGLDRSGTLHFDTCALGAEQFKSLHGFSLGFDRLARMAAAIARTARGSEPPEPEVPEAASGVWREVARVPASPPSSSRSC